MGDPVSFNALLRANQARLLKGVLITYAAILCAVIVLLVAFPSYMSGGGEIIEPLLRNVVPLAVVGLLLLMLRYEYVQTTVWIMIAVAFFMTPYTAYLEAEQNLQMLGLLMFPVVMAGLLLSRLQLWLVFSATVINSVATFWMLNELRAAQLSSEGLVTHLLTLTLFAILIDGLSHAYRLNVVDNWRRFRELDDNRRELAESNRDLSAALEDRDRVVRELAQREMTERLALESSRAGTWQVDLDTGTLMFNRQHWLLHGREPENEAPDFTEYQTWVHPEDLDELMASIAKVIDQDGFRHETAYRIVRPDGAIRWLYSVGEYRTESANDRAIFAGVTLDITERQEEEQSRQVAEERIRESHRLESLGLLAGGLAHDFNNLLLIIMGNIRLSIDQLPDGSETSESLDDALAAAQHAADLCRSLLAYSGKSPVNAENVQLDALVGGMNNLLDVAVPKLVELRYEIDHAAPVVIAGDVSRIQQIVLNLVSNSVDSLRGATGTISVGVGITTLDADDLRAYHNCDALHAGTHAFLKVSDNGCGMDEITTRRVFEPFYSTKSEGRGLGLAAVLGSIRAHGAAVRIESEPGSGTVVTILFPLSDAPASAAPETKLSTTSDVGSGLILVVDDEVGVRRLATRILASAGYATIEAADGIEAIEAFKEHRQDITAILLDLSMPRMDGHEAFKHIRALDPTAIVVISTGYDKTALMESPEGELIRYAIEKPYSPTDLISAIENATASSDSRSA